MLHNLKIWPRYFKEVKNGLKTFEIRINDRDYKVGDILKLMEFNYETRNYTGNEIFVIITYLTNDKPYVPDGYVCMSIKEVK